MHLRKFDFTFRYLFYRCYCDRFIAQIIFFTSWASLVGTRRSRSTVLYCGSRMTTNVQYEVHDAHTAHPSPLHPRSIASAPLAHIRRRCYSLHTAVSITNTIARRYPFAPVHLLLPSQTPSLAAAHSPLSICFTASITHTTSFDHHRRSTAHRTRRRRLP